MMRMKQRAHRKEKQTGQPRDWERFKRQTRKAHRSYMQNVASADMKGKPKRFWVGGVGCDGVGWDFGWVKWVGG